MSTAFKRLTDWNSDDTPTAYTADSFEFQRDLNDVLRSHAALLAGLKLLAADVQDYEAWQRPSHALDVARAAIANAEAE